MLGRLPADKGLCPAKLFRSRIVLGLIVDDEFLVFEGVHLLFLNFILPLLLFYDFVVKYCYS